MGESSDRQARGPDSADGPRSVFGGRQVSRGAQLTAVDVLRSGLGSVVIAALLVAAHLMLGVPAAAAPTPPPHPTRPPPPSQAPAPSQAATVRLTYTVNGPGTGTISFDPVGQSCGTGCLLYPNPTPVAALALPSGPKSYFAGWSGDCSGAINPCSILMDRSRSIAATFGLDSDPPVFSGIPSPPPTEATGPSGAAVTYTLPSAADAVDGPVPVTCAPASGSTFAIGQTTVTCTASDSHGNTATAAFTVAVVDTTGPVISGTPSNITAEATSASGAVVTYVAPTGVDVVDGARAVTCSPASGSTFTLDLVATVTCSASDTRGNSSQTTFTVTVRDTTAPTMAGVPTDIVMEATGPSGAIVTYTAPTASDVVDGPVPMSCAPASGSTFALGTTTVMCEAADAHANAASATFMVTVRDTTAPVITVPATLVTARMTSAAGAPVTYAQPTATDTVDGPVAVGCAPASGSTFPIGDTAVTCTASDSRGNTSTATFTVRVTNDPPVLTVPASPVTTNTGITLTFTVTASDPDGTVTALTASVLPSGATFTDQGNSTGVFTWTPTASQAGTYSITFRATDPAGLFDQESVTITAVVYMLEVSLTGTGGGTVTSSPVGITCGTTCSATFDPGSIVTLTAAPDAVSTFEGWGGACTGTGPCTVTMTASSILVSATFSPSLPGATVLFQLGGPGDEDGRFRDPLAVAVCPSGHVYVASRYKVQKFTSSGEFVLKWGSQGNTSNPQQSGDGQFVFPNGIACDASDNVYVADGDAKRVQKFDANGQFLLRWGSYGSGIGQFIGTHGIAVWDGYVYVSDASRIQKFTSSGAFVSSWGPAISGDGRFDPTGLAIAPNGDVYVADYQNSRIQYFSAAGESLGSWTTQTGTTPFRLPYRVAVDPAGQIYVSDYGSYSAYVERFGLDGTVTARFGGSVPGYGGVGIIYGLAADGDGNVYVVDYNNQRVLKFAPQ